MMSEKLVSIVVPCYNESACIESFIPAINALEIKNPIEFVFVDDGSRDDTLEKIKRLAANDKRVHYVSFSRNFGKESGLLAGLSFAKGDMVVTMDADLQHSPAILPEMISGIEEGYDCVATRRTDRKGEPAVRSWFAHKFYALMSHYSEVRLEDGVMDYRMMTRQVVDSVLRLQETNRFTKGIYQWVGFKTKWLEVENVERTAGESKWSFTGLLLYSIKGIVSFTTAPLQIVSILGCICCASSLVYALYILVKWLVVGETVLGWPTLVCTTLMLGGIQLFGMGIIGTYIAFIYREVKHRPPYLVREQA